MEEIKETVNIYLKSDSDKKNVLSGASSHSKYIILMNETLQVENREMRTNIIEFENKLKESEEEEDRHDISKRYIKGLLKNLVEMEKMRSETAKLEKEIGKSALACHVLFKAKAIKHLRMLEAILFIVFGFIHEIEFLTNKQFCLYFITVIFVVAFVENMIKAMIFPSNHDKNIRIDIINLEIKKITDAQDYLSEYIDSL
jgi:hypothetical protein